MLLFAVIQKHAKHSNAARRHTDTKPPQGSDQRAKPLLARLCLLVVTNHLRALTEKGARPHTQASLLDIAIHLRSVQHPVYIGSAEDHVRTVECIHIIIIFKACLVIRRAYLPYHQHDGILIRTDAASAHHCYIVGSGGHGNKGEQIVRNAAFRARNFLLKLLPLGAVQQLCPIHDRRC